MSAAPFIGYWIFSMAIFIGFFFLAYYIIKKAVKNGILEAYKKIHNEP